MKRYISVILVSLIFVLSLYGAFKIGEVKAKQREREALAFATLQVVQPAIQIIDFSEKNPGVVPGIVVANAHGSDHLVANLSFLFAKNPQRLSEDSQNVLCAIAKDRERYRKKNPDIYDSALIAHLAGIEKELINNNSILSCAV